MPKKIQTYDDYVTSRVVAYEGDAAGVSQASDTLQMFITLVVRQARRQGFLDGWNACEAELTK